MGKALHRALVLDVIWPKGVRRMWVKMSNEPFAKTKRVVFDEWHIALVRRHDGIPLIKVVVFGDDDRSWEVDIHKVPKELRKKFVVALRKFFEELEGKMDKSELEALKNDTFEWLKMNGFKV